MDGSLADFDKTNVGVKRVGCGVRRINVDLANHSSMTTSDRFGKQIKIEPLRKPLAPHPVCNNDAVNVDKSLPPLLEPVEVGVVVWSILVQRNQQRTRAVVKASCVKRHPYQSSQAHRIQQGSLIGMRIVEIQSRKQVLRSEVLNFVHGALQMIARHQAYLLLA